MARTKKQTLENASERKRQIQEEIFRETLAAKETKEHSFEADQGKNSLQKEKIPESLSETSLLAVKSETKSAEMDTTLGLFFMLSFLIISLLYKNHIIKSKLLTTSISVKDEYLFSATYLAIVEV